MTKPSKLLALIAACVLAACSSVPGPPPPVRLPVEVNDNAAIPSVRLSWHNAPGTAPGTSFVTGVEIEYDRSSGQTDQHLGANDFVQLDNKALTGPQDVRHRADLRYGHLAFNGIWRLQGNASQLELDLVAGLGEAQLGLRSENRATGLDELAAKYSLAGVVLGVGPRWNFTDTLAVQGRFQVLASSPSSDEKFWYREIALRYRPVKNVALRMGLSQMDYRPMKLSDGDSPVHVRVYGPSLGLDLMF